MIRVTVTLLLLMCAVAAAQEPVRELRRAFRATDDPRAAYEARVTSLDAVDAVVSPEVAEVLLAAWSRVHQEARAAERARGRPAENLVPSVTEMRERVALDECLRLMTQVEAKLAGATRPALERVLEEVLTGNLPVQARAALAPLGAKLGAAALAPVRAAVADATRPDDAFVALRVLESLAAAAAAAGPDVEPLLAHRESIVRVQAARTIAAVGYRRGAPGLIDRLDTEQGRVRRRIADALEELTGQTLGTATPSWRAWWDAEGEVFVRIGKRPKGERRVPPRPDAAATRGAYFGIPQDGQAVMYLVDFSKSMRNLWRGKDGPTRWQECVRELGQAIEQLGPDRTFNIVVFAQRVVAWSDRQVPADERNVAAAKAWIEALELELGTAIFEAFEVAFALGGQNLEDRYFEPVIDTIFFLSDGLPTVRRPDSPRQLAQDDPALVLALVGRRNPFRSVVVHCVMLGRQGGGKLMRPLARENGGTFVAH